MIKKIGLMIGLDLQYFLGNGFWVILRNVVVSIAGLVVLVVFTKISSKEVVGNYQLILSIFTLLSVFSLPGLNTAITQAVSRNLDGDYQRAIRTSFRWSLIAIPIMFLIGMYFNIYREGSLGLTLFISAFFFPFFYAFNSWDSFLQGKMKYKLSSIYGIFQALFGICVVLLTLNYFPENTLAIVLAYVASYSLLNYFFYKRSERYIKNEATDSETMAYGFRLSKISALALLADSFDKILIGMFSVGTLAVYSVALTLSDSLRNSIKSFFSVAFPKFSQAEDKKSLKYEGWVFIFGVLLALVVYGISDFVILSLFSENYRESSRIFQFLIPLIPIYCLNSFYGYYILAKKESNSKVLFLINFIVPVISIVFSLLLFIFTGNLLLLLLVKIYSRHLLSLLSCLWFAHFSDSVESRLVTR